MHRSFEPAKFDDRRAQGSAKFSRPTEKVLRPRGVAWFRRHRVRRREAYSEGDGEPSRCLVLLKTATRVRCSFSLVSARSERGARRTRAQRMALTMSFGPREQTASRAGCPRPPWRGRRPRSIRGPSAFQPPSSPVREGPPSLHHLRCHARLHERCGLTTNLFERRRLRARARGWSRDQAPEARWSSTERAPVPARIRFAVIMSSTVPCATTTN